MLPSILKTTIRPSWTQRMKLMLGMAVAPKYAFHGVSPEILPGALTQSRRLSIVLANCVCPR